MSSVARFSATVLAAGLVLFSLACGAPSAGPPAETPASADQPQYGGTFRAPITDDLFNYDMSLQGSSVPNPYVIKVAYNSLLGRRLGPDVGYGQTIVAPMLAQRWEVSPDAKTYTFHLNQGVRFADLPPVNGRELTSADVKFSYEYMSRTGAFKDAGLPPSQFAYLFGGLDGIEAPDPYTVVVRFREGFAPFLNYAASSDNVIMPHEIYDQDGNFAGQIAGSGAFQLDAGASQHGASWSLKKNPNYFEQGKPYLDTIQLVIIKDDATAQAAYRSKQIDYYLTSNFHTAGAFRSANADAVETVIGYTPAILGVNSKRPPLDNPKIRQAISLALDRDEVINATQGGKGGWALAFSNVREDLFSQEEIKSFIKYDPDRARELLAEAGYPDGLTQELLYTRGTQQTEDSVQLVQSQLKRAGLSLTLRGVTNDENVGRRRARQFDLLFLSEAPYSDLDGSLNLAIASTGSFNYNQIDDPKVNELLAAQRREGDPARRTALLKEVLRYVNETALAIPTWRLTQYQFAHPYVRGFYQNADLRTQGAMQYAWVAKQP